MDANKQKCKLLEAQVEALTSRVETLESNNKILTVVTKRIIRKNLNLTSEQNTLKLLPDKLSILENDYKSSISKIGELEDVIKNLKGKVITPMASADSSLADVAVDSNASQIQQACFDGISGALRAAQEKYPNTFPPVVLNRIAISTEDAIQT
jgi:uncharacterized protein (UPF0335 family)